MATRRQSLVARAATALRQRVCAWRALRTARAAAAARLAGPTVRRVLVVCYGNIYRSPLYGEILRARSDNALEIRSAGFHPRAGRESPAAYVALCAQRGHALAAHRSAVVTPDDILWADTIVFMDRHNWSALDRMGAPVEKLFWAGALSDGSVEIADPYDLPVSQVESIVGEIELAAQRFAARVRGVAR